jgi:Tc toxin complex TcA C-terminal TcB-binding domain/Neuraminidase-like domain/Salmonella virulence plasmid 28.1kDa A protein/Putative peptidoglycan binding domain
LKTVIWNAIPKEINMKLNGRDLTRGLSGDDVKLLHFELKQLGFTIPGAEVDIATFGVETFAAVRLFQTSHQLRPTGTVDQITATAINRDFDALSLVQGQVSDGNGAPLKDVRVQAFDKDLRSEQPLGESVLSKEGRYEIRYSADKFSRAEKRLADLIVRVLDRTGKILFSSDVIFNAPHKQTVDIVLNEKARLSEFERHDKDIEPLLDGVKWAELTEADIDFLARETGVPEMHLAFLVVAHQHEATTKVAASLFYGLFRENAPTSLPALLTQSHRTLRTALDSAIEGNIIPQFSEAELNSAVQTLLRQRRDHLLRATGDSAAISGLLGAAGLNGDQQGQFLEAYLSFEGDSEQFWDSLKSTPLSGQVRSIQNTLQMGLLTQNNVPLLQSLTKRRIQSIRDLAKIKPDELKKMALDSREILAAIPAEEESETDETKATRFSHELFEVLYDTVPTALVQDAFERSTDTIRSSAAKVLSRLPDFELRDDDLGKALADNPRALDGIADLEKVKGMLKRIQRTLRVAPQPHHAQLLLDEGLDSAASITSLSPAAFQERYGERLGGVDQARMVYSRAQQISDSALAIISTLQQSIADVLPAAIEPVPDAVKSLPNFTTLFGPQSLCSCSHCRSVLSPAAYLVDLLEFLNPKGDKKPIEKLRSKRPDIEHMLLSCDNTNTPIPYIDLVNEVLEFYVAQGKLTAEAARNTTGTSAAELNANPQNVIQSAYDTLAKAVYPHSLPFHRPLEIARLHLNHLGASRHALMQACQRNGSPTEMELACESLQMTPMELEIVTGASDRPLTDFYNLSAAQNPETLSTIKVSDFLQSTSLTYEQLQELLKTAFLNPNADIKLVGEDNPPQCDLNRIALKGLTPKFWQDAHRFLRLRGIVDWTLAELDLVFLTMGIVQITNDNMIRLAAMKQLQSQTKLTVEVLASLVGVMNAKLPNSLYQNLFLSKSVLNSTALSVFEAVRDGTSTAILGDHRSTIAAALRMSEADIDLLLEHLSFDALTPMTLNSLSALHRFAILARAIRLPVRDLIALTKLTEQPPFVDGDPRATLDFIEAANKVRQSGFTVDQLYYLYYHESDASRPLQPTIESQLPLLRTLKSSLQATQHTENNSQAPKLDLVRVGLSEVIDEAVVNTALLIIQGLDTLASEARATFVNEHFAKFVNPEKALATLQNPAIIVDDRLTYIQNALTHYKQSGLVVQLLSESLGIDSRLMLGLLRDFLQSVDTSNEPLLQSFLRLTNVKIPATEKPVSLAEIDANLKPILDGLLRLQKAALLVQGFDMTDSEVRLFGTQGADFAGFNWNELPIKAGGSPSQLQSWHRLAGWYRLRKSLPQQAATLADVGLEAAKLIPLETGEADADPRLRAISKLKQASGWSEDEVDFLVGPKGFDLNQASDFLDERQLARIQVCIEMSRRLGVSCSTLFAWTTGSIDGNLAEQVVAAAKSKYSDEQWLSIARPLNDELRERQKSALVSYVLAHDPAVKKAGITHGNGLFEYFLIDVEMSACAKTSRIKQATASIQLFVQRCLLNLEDSVSPSAIDVDRWEWMNNYRVWEANRKVFLYPENWIEPELRDDKSPFFQELESALLQNDLSWSTAEDAYVNYLEKLEQVARLQPCGMYVEEAQEPGDDEIVHVFGRTMASPHSHYYRKLINGHRWTPWEKLDQEIDGDHLIPVVRNRRLYLMWLTFEEKPDEVQELPYPFVQSIEHWRWVNVAMPAWEKEHALWTTDHTMWLREKQILDWSLSHVSPELKEQIVSLTLRDEPAEPRRPEEPAFSSQPPLSHWEIKLAWIEHKDGRWSSRQTSTDSVVSPNVVTNIQDLFVERPDLGQFIWHMAFYKLIPPRKKDSTDPADYEKTIISVHLPEQSSHFARVGKLPFGKGDDDGPLTIWLFRRYAHAEKVLQQKTYPIEGYETLGYFQLHCGQKVDTFSAAKPIKEPSFDSLARPDGTQNEFMRYTGSTNSLSFTPNTKSVEILGSGQGAFDILYQHQDFSFQLRPPYQSFFYDDPAKTFFATYADDEPSRLLTVPGRAIAAIPIPSHVPLLQSLAKRKVDVPLKKVATKPDAQPDPRSQAFLIPKASSGKLGAVKRITHRANDGRIDALKLPKQGLRFETFFHPHICEWMQRLYRDGLPGFLTRSSQQLSNKAKNGANLFVVRYKPTPLVARPYPTELVDFDRGAFACYNWELFFHIPMLIAISLSKNQRFEEAMKWFHFVFNPMTDDPQASRRRYWNALPFYQNTATEHEQIQNLLAKLANKSKGWQEIEAQIDEWRSNPFNPHLIARMRLTAYQKHVVMKYIDNIIAWADQLFSRDTLESINEATMLYVLAWNILGNRPQMVARHDEAAPKSYRQIANDLDAFGNTLVDVEGLVPYQSILKSGSRRFSPQSSQKQSTRRPFRRPGGIGIHKSAIRTLHFCVPPNEEMLRYWDTVEDRLFKIRHCMNIEGVSRQLPLFEPPIDPALLVKATAAGLDLGSVLNDMLAPLPHYRFNVVLQKATELCNELKSLGGSLLSALEKSDAEEISNLRSSQETNLLKSIRQLKKQQIDEAKANIEALKRTRLTTEARYNYYRDIERISDNEQAQLEDMSTAHRFNLASQGLQVAASAAFYIPNFTTGTSGMPPGPVTTLSYGGGLTFGPALQAGATIASMIASEYSYQGTRSSVVGGYARRWEDWKLQETLASRELDQIDKQITAAEIRLAITEKELENHEQQIANSEAVEQFLRSKFTNEELYNWMIAQTSKVYFQTYKLAYDLAKRAERTYRIELGLPQSDFVRFGYWDNLRKGLMAGDQLTLDLKRMDLAYLEKNKREYELTKHVSMLQLNPKSLIQLRQTGECRFHIPEWCFDLDNPGHYLRRIKNVSLSIPCVTGAYTGVNCTLSLEKSQTRITSDATNSDNYARAEADTRFSDSFGLVQSIVASTAQNDGGLFETNFRDERYLPFENAGAISTWKLRLPAHPQTGFTQFDYDTISDVVLHLRYTARDGGDVFRTAAVKAIENETVAASNPECTRLLSVRHEFPTEWAKLQNQTESLDSQFLLTLKLRTEHYPFWARRLNKVAQIQIFIGSKEQPQSGNLKIAIALPAASPVPVPLSHIKTEDEDYGELFVGVLSNLSAEPTGDLKVMLKSKAVSDIWFTVSLARGN